MRGSAQCTRCRGRSAAPTVEPGWRSRPAYDPFETADREGLRYVGGPAVWRGHARAPVHRGITQTPSAPALEYPDAAGRTAAAGPDSAGAVEDRNSGVDGDGHGVADDYAGRLDAVTISRPPKTYEKELLALFWFLWWVAEADEKESLRQVLRKLIDWLAGLGTVS